jgi:urease accessory protein
MRTASSDDLGGAMASPTAIRRAPHGWRAELDLRFARRRGGTLIAERRQSGPLTVQRPFYPEADGVCHTYLLHPPAGIVGGDELAMRFDLEPDAHALVTTPAATRWYFSRGLEARARQHATLADGATLEWLPQETLVFDGAHARLETRIDLAGGARFCGWEILGLGRPACGEKFRSGPIYFRFQISRAGRPLLLERRRGAHGGIAGMREHAACATFLATPAAASALDAAREVLAAVPDVLAGATLIGDLLIGRGLAAGCEPLTQTFGKLWSALRPLILGRSAVPPRIWQT